MGFDIWHQSEIQVIAEKWLQVPNASLETLSVFKACGGSKTCFVGIPKITRRWNPYYYPRTRGLSLDKHRRVLARAGNLLLSYVPILAFHNASLNLGRILLHLKKRIQELKTYWIEIQYGTGQKPNDTDRISGYDVHSTKNGISLTTELHGLFGDFELTFAETHKPGVYTTHLTFDEYGAEYEIIPETVKLEAYDRLRRQNAIWSPAKNASHYQKDASLC